MLKWRKEYGVTHPRPNRYRLIVADEVQGSDNNPIESKTKDEVNPMARMIKDCADPALGEAIEIACYDWFKPWRKAPQVQFYETDIIKRLTTKVSHPMWNGVFLAKLTEENVDEKIKENIGYFKELELPWVWFIGPSSRPHDLQKRIEEYGLTHNFIMPGMAVELESMRDDFSTPPELKVKLASDLGTLRDFVDVASKVMKLFMGQTYEFFLYEATAIFDDEIPRYDYVGYLNDIPVATSTLVCSETVAGVQIVCTLPEARGRGIGTEMTMATLRKAQSLGYKVGVLQTSEMGHKVYRKIGFKECCEMGFYRFPD
jgi:GNAT superfamily N-acetyltransferase